MQDHGDAMRLAARDNAAVARAVVGGIRVARAEASGLAEGELDGKPRAYIIDSLRHPAEAHLLRRLYQDAFTLVGVVCDPEKRSRRLRTELYNLDDRQTEATKAAIAAFMDRDADAPEKHGQHVVDTFHEADFFVDNSKDAEDDPNNTAMNEPLRRLVRLLTLSEVIRPNVAETAMHQAHSAQLKSACLSRQVGAALVDAQGNVIATGRTRCPRPGEVSTARPSSPVTTSGVPSGRTGTAAATGNRTPSSTRCSLRIPCCSRTGKGPWSSPNSGARGWVG